jgi:acyl-CoA thioesterase
MTHVVENPVDYARNVVGQDPMARLLGIAVEEAREGYARCSAIIGNDHLNAVERAHGAMIYAIADQVFAVASNSTGVMALSLHFSISYHSAANAGEKLFAEAVPVNLGRKTSVWRVEVRGSGDRIVATGEGVAYHR